MQTKKLVQLGLFAALTAAATFVIRIPTGMTGGYVNLGDCLVLLCAYFMGSLWGALAAGIGSALSDLLGGYMTYVIPTLVIKVLMAAVAGILLKKLGKKSFSALFGYGLLAELIMVAGYFLFEILLLGSVFSAATAIPANCTQGLFGMLSAAILFRALEKNAAVRRYFDFENV